MIPFVPMPPFEYGRTDLVSPLIRRVIANNPGPFTFTGTGTYIVGRPEAGAGVAVELELWPDTAHGFQMAPFLPEAGLALAQIAAFVQARTGWRP